jgi:hypothetical protein
VPLHVIQRQASLRVNAFGALQVAFRDVRGSCRGGECSSMDLALLQCGERKVKSRLAALLAAIKVVYANPLHLRGEVVDCGSELVLLHLGLLVAHVDSWLHGQSLAEFALSVSSSSAVARKRIFDSSETVAVLHQMPQNAVQSGLTETIRMRD